MRITPPITRNELGLTVAEAEREPDSEAVYREWRRIVVQYGILDLQVHDARLRRQHFSSKKLLTKHTRRSLMGGLAV
jgi:hypothetical protein